MKLLDKIDMYLNEAQAMKTPPQAVYDMVRKLRKSGLSDEQISKKMKITLNTVQGIK